MEQSLIIYGFIGLNVILKDTKNIVYIRKRFNWLIPDGI